GAPSVNARERIGHGPWYNAKGTLIARDLDELHGTNMLTKQTALTEKGAVVNGRGDTPNMHEILTGSQPDGKAFPPDKDMTCKNWTSSTGGAAMLGHSDRTGLTDDPPGRSWNSSHPSRDCSQDGLRSTAGAGLFYCFATNWTYDAGGNEVFSRYGQAHSFAESCPKIGDAPKSPLQRLQTTAYRPWAQMTTDPPKPIVEASPTDDSAHDLTHRSLQL